MCRQLAYAGSPICLHQLLVEPEWSLIAQSRAARLAKTPVNGDGSGVGWYGARPEPELYRGTRPAWSDNEFLAFARQTSSPLFLAHVRAATSGAVSPENCHPFGEGRQLFMHNGQVRNYERLRNRIDALIGKDHAPLRRGSCDSEAIFLSACGRGLQDDPIAALSKTLAAIATIVAEAGLDGTNSQSNGGEDGHLSFAATYCDGERLIAFRWSDRGQPPSLYWRRLNHAAGAGVVIASEPYDAADEAWTIVPPSSVLSVWPDGRMTIAPFAPDRDPAALSGQEATRALASACRDRAVA